MYKNPELLWLDKEKYPHLQSEKFCVAEFEKTVDFCGELQIDVSAFARYMLFVNGQYVGRGPTSVGGDFLYPVINEAYYESYTVNATGKTVITVLVTSVPTAMTEHNFGFCGLFIRVNGAMGEWRCRVLNRRKDALYTDYTLEPSIFECPSSFKPSITLIPSPLHKLKEDKICPCNFEKITLKGRESKKALILFDKIYSAYPHVEISCQGKCEIKLTSSEEGQGGIVTENVVTDKSVHHFSPLMRSIGQIELEIKNCSDFDMTVEDVYIDFVRYPVLEEGKFTSSDLLINKIYDVCMHTLKICRQTIHLDSPTHQEPLACTGDYYIQSLIEYLSIKDATLARCDIERTANLLKIQDGRIFHTTYSLIYPWWVFDHYMHTADKDIIDKKALDLLLNRFDTYVSQENGLLEFAPDYMFVDWVVAKCDEDGFLDGGNMMSHGKMEGYSLHHPPKALGQSVLCMFYYNALIKSASLYEILGEAEAAKECIKKADNLKSSINKYLFDTSKGLYVGGLNTPNQVKEGSWLPKNTKTVYYLKQANTLAVLFGIAPKEARRDILKYVVTDLSKLEMQPYFYHYLLEALYKEGLFERYGMELIRRYKSLIDRCDKGLSEAWENMKCDYSHAWGASPAYVLKKAICGLEILEPGFKKIKISPCLFDLSFAEVEITTPYGIIEVCINEENISVKAPKEIQIVDR